MNEVSKRPRARVLLVAFGCSPYLGSEPGLGWHRVLEIAKRHEAWVICEGPPELIANIDRYQAENGPVPGLHFHFIPLTRLEQRFMKLPGLYYVGYRNWERRAYREALRMHRERPFDLVHHVNLGTYREPGYPSRLGIPVIWGPVGGTQNLPWRFLCHNGIKAALPEALRSAFNVMQFRFSPRVRRAVRQAAAVVTSSSTGERDFRRVYGIEPVLLCDCGATSVAETPKADDETGRPLRILWLGPFQSRKALDLLLMALAHVPDSVDYEVRIVGDGKMRDRWRRLAQRLGVDHRCQWLGVVPHAEALKQYEWADVYAFTSLRDTVAAVVLEALSYGVPLIGMDHQGTADVVTENCGIKIPVTTVDEAVQRYAHAITTLARDRAQVARLSRGALERTRRYLWSRNGELMEEVYRRVLARRGGAGVEAPAVAGSQAR